jgi:hypothetical protein
MADIDPNAAPPAPTNGEPKAPDNNVATTGNGSSPDSVVDVTKLDAEVAKPSAGAETFDVLAAELGDVEGAKQDGYFTGITAEHIKALDPVARRAIHNVRVAAAQAKVAADAKVAEADKKYDSRANALAQAERDLHRRTTEFHALINSDEVKKLLQVPEGDLPDPMSPEGIEARIKRQVAEGLGAALKPMADKAAELQGQRALLDFIDANPEMKDAAFKKEVVDLIRARKTTNTPISTEDAVALTRASRTMKAEEARRKTEAHARAESARRVARVTTQGNPGGEGVPNDVRRQGAVATARWLQANPQAAARIRAQHAR